MARLAILGNDFFVFRIVLVGRLVLALLSRGLGLRSMKCRVGFPTNKERERRSPYLAEYLAARRKETPWPTETYSEAGALRADYSATGGQESLFGRMSPSEPSTGD